MVASGHGASEQGAPLKPMNQSPYKAEEVGERGRGRAARNLGGGSGASRTRKSPPDGGLDRFHGLATLNE